MNLKNSSFRALMATQFLGAFNDNVFKTAIALFVMAWVHDPVSANNWKTLSLVVFGAPFLLFSLVAGRMADRFRKSTITKWTKVFELGVVLVCAAGVVLRHIPLMMGGLFFLAAQSAFFGPSKYGILPELVDNNNLSRANAYLNMFTFAAILLGSVLGSLLSVHPHHVATAMAIAALMGLAASLFITPTPVANASVRLQWNPIPDLIANWTLAGGVPLLRRCIVSVTFFWFLGAVLQINTLSFVHETMGGNEKIAALLLGIVVVGISAGSLLAATLSRSANDLRWVIPGSLVMSLFMIDLGWSAPSIIRAGVDLFILSAGAGIFVIPLNTFIQSQSPPEIRGRILSTVNFLAFLAIVTSGGYLWLLGSFWQLNARQIFLALALTALASTAFIAYLLNSKSDNSFKMSRGILKGVSNDDLLKMRREDRAIEEPENKD